MRYHYQPGEDTHVRNKGISITSYRCDHPLYNRCTLYFVDNLGLAVIQEFYNSRMKHRWWGEVLKPLSIDIYTHKDFDKAFYSLAGPKDRKGVYPTISVRKLMWKLRMKPLSKENWERCEV